MRGDGWFTHEAKMITEFKSEGGADGGNFVFRVERNGHKGKGRLTRNTVLAEGTHEHAVTNLAGELIPG